jgi:integrase
MENSSDTPKCASKGKMHALHPLFYQRMSALLIGEFLMSSIAKRPDGKWRARYRDAKGKEHSRHFRRKVDATRFLDGVTTAITTGTNVDPGKSKVTVGEWSQRWLDGVQVKPSTRATYASLLRCHVMPTWSDVPLSAVTHVDVRAWTASLAARGLAPSTVRQSHRVLSLVLGLAVRDGRMSRNPADGAPLPRVRTPGKRFLGYEEVAALADAAAEQRREYGLVVRVLALCGLRFGELAALRVGRVDLLRRRMNIEQSVTEVNGRAVFGTPKSNLSRSVPIPHSLASDLAAAMVGKGADDFVFTAPEGGVLLLRNFRRRAFNPACRAAGLDGLTPHELRHTAASLAVSAGANVKAVQRMLGHASAAMTLDVYSGLFDDDLDGLADRMDAALAQARADFSRTEALAVDLSGRRASR